MAARRSRSKRRSSALRRLSFAVLALLLSCAFARAANEGPNDPLARYRQTGQSRKCIQSYEINETRVVSPDQILFRLRVRDTYVNRLSRPCPGLRLYGAFEHTLRGDSQVCRGDAIRVLDGTGTGAGCILGAFERLEEKRPATPEGDLRSP